MENSQNTKQWFRAKRYGWGWYPTTWQGWAIILLYTIATTLHFINIDKFSHSASDTLINFLLPFIINTTFLLIICFIKGEKPEWRWGEKEK
jgi:uncharacterized membrane protein YhaH (DUF805 family)